MAFSRLPIEPVILLRDLMVSIKTHVCENWLKIPEAPHDISHIDGYDFHVKNTRYDCFYEIFKHYIYAHTNLQINYSTVISFKLKIAKVKIISTHKESKSKPLSSKPNKKHDVTSYTTYMHMHLHNNANE